MKRSYAILILAVIAACILIYACSGIRPLRKGETVRCPSCGAEFTVEEGQKAREKAQ